MRTLQVNFSFSIFFIIISGREDFIKYWLRFCSKINEKSEEQKAIYIAKFKNFLLELGIHLVSSLKYTAAELSSINTLALDTSKKNEKDEDGDDDEYDIDYDEKDEIQRELNYKKKLISDKIKLKLIFL